MAVKTEEIIRMLWDLKATESDINSLEIELANLKTWYSAQLPGNGKEEVYSGASRKYTSVGAVIVRDEHSISPLASIPPIRDPG